MGAVAPLLAALAPEQKPAEVERDVVNEAYDLVAAFVDSDGLHTDDELWALIAAFGPRMDTQLSRATPADVRTAGIVAGKRAWLDRPSLLFDTLLAADRKKGTTHAWGYYIAAMRLAHVVASLDAHTAHAELDALDRFRTMLLGAIGDARPQQRAAAGATAADAATQAEEAAEPQEPPRPLEDLLAELEELIGLDAVKAEVKLVANLLQVRKLRSERGLEVPDASHHLVFTGNPGTGKTTVARLLAQIYRTLGLVEKGHLIETDRSQLVAGFVGQTAIRVREVFDKADGGVLLVDEAYSLVRGSEQDFGREAIDTIVKLVEDRRDSTVVIVAGYPDEMALFVNANPGLRSRFPKTIHFPDYTTDELLGIFDILARKAQYRADDSARDALSAHLDAVPRDRAFGNGRLVRNLFEHAIAQQAGRIVEIENPTDEQLQTLVADDIPAYAPAS